MDTIARTMGVPADDPHRMECGVQYVLAEAAASEGHTFLPEPVLAASAAQLLGAGGRAVTDAEADLVVVNTCTVTVSYTHLAVYKRQC